MSMEGKSLSADQVAAIAAGLCRRFEGYCARH